MKLHGIKPNPSYIHHRKNQIVDRIREIVFGMQDGMVSTLGVITGIAIGSGEKFIILLAGIAIISVESVSMGIGSYISTRSHRRIIERMLVEEKEEINTFPKEEKEELITLLTDDGWSQDTANIMADEANNNKTLMLREMAYRELHISLNSLEHPAENGLFMFGAYIAGGIIPLSAYFFLETSKAMSLSIAITLLGLFILGASISKYTKEEWYKAGAHMLLFGSVALLVGYIVGTFSQVLIV